MKFFFYLLLIISPPLFANQLSTDVSHYGDEWILTAYGNTDITDNVSVNAELDSTGYLALGTGYGFFFPQAYIEPYLKYGRGEGLDV